MPEKIPALDCSLRELSGMSYQETAYEVMKLFFTDFTEQELRDCISRAYDSKFDTEEIAPLAKGRRRLCIWNCFTEVRLHSGYGAVDSAPSDDDGSQKKQGR